MSPESNRSARGPVSQSGSPNLAPALLQLETRGLWDRLEEPGRW